VPKVTGKALGAAKRALGKAHCGVGKVRRAYSTRVAAGRVLSQSPRHGRRLVFGARVSLVVSRGPRGLAGPQSSQFRHEGVTDT
jgi:beta-lactam-binding protein with PASTA domain